MKYRFLFIFYFIISGHLASTADDDDYGITTFSNNINLLNLDIPASRNIHGGTRIIPIFEGSEWTPAQQSAFKIACEIWEEALPTSLPIIIEAQMIKRNMDAGTNSILTKVTSREKNGFSEYDGWYTHLTSKMKYMAYRELTEQSGSVISFLLDSVCFTEADIHIDFYSYNNMDDIYSYSLDASTITDKYDFITTSLRCIGTGLGISWRSRRINHSTQELPVSSNQIPYESVLLTELGNTNHQRYINAQQGNFTVTENQNSYTIYAPTVWDNNLSLNYFVSDSTKKITQLMAYDFAKGYVVRDLIDQSSNDIFADLLGWNDIIGVGMPANDTSFEESNQSSLTAFPYQGNLSCSFDNANTRATQQDSARLNNKKKQLLTRDYNWYNTNSFVNEKILSAHPNLRMNGSVSDYGWTVSLQKNDGSWDVVYQDNSDENTLNISYSSLLLHDIEENYARTYNGYYKCRLSYNSYDDQTLYVYYAKINALPQKALVAPQKSKFLSGYYEDEYTKTVKIDFGNLEGVTSVEVSQLDEGFTIPYIFTVNDFKKGYFLAVVDKEYDTTFSITYYNSNGYSIKNFIFHPTQVLQTNASLSISRQGNAIRVIGGDIQSTSLVALPTSTIVATDIHTGNVIDISSISKGTYLLQVIDRNGNHQSYKFTK